MTLQVTSEEKKRCFEFANSIIRDGNQFNRFNQDIEVQIIRTYVGKLAEYVFYHFLLSKNIKVSEGDMFEVFQGGQNADTFDFVLSNGNTIDIKTASLPYHTRIMIPDSQFHLRKDFYVGIKLNFKVGFNNLIDPYNIDTAQIYGYIEREILEIQPSKYFGEGYCKSYPLNQMKAIDELLKMF